MAMAPPQQQMAPPPQQQMSMAPPQQQMAPPAAGGGGSCPSLNAMAAALGVRAPPAGTWIQMFLAVAEQLPVAMLISDMLVPGVKVMAVNTANERLTGYPKAEQVGKNCRFLQGKETEAAAVRALVSSIRNARPTTVRITNYKKDGSPFVNVLTLHPVHDSSGTYRYSVGVQADGANEAQEGPMLAKLRAALPTTFDAALQPKAFEESLTDVNYEAQRKQWKSSLAKFTRLLWSMDWESSLRMLAAMPQSAQAFGQWLQANNPAGAGLMSQMGAGGAQGEAALKQLAAEAFPKFVQSKACLPLVESLVGAAGDELKKADALLWSEYKVPADCAGWLHSFASVAETYPSCIVISDMSIPGNPMIFVNAEFCRTTGYLKQEAQGRNCRFLQGPRTEPQSVAVIQDTLRRGVDCHVKLTNYRKTGELFENLLTMRPVHDSNGVYRFCIGVQFEVTRDMSLKSRLARLEKLIKLLPSHIEVSSRATGEVGPGRAEVAVEASTALDVKLESALAGATVGPSLDAMVIAKPGFYSENHSDMLNMIGVAPHWAQLQQLLEGPEGAGASQATQADGVAASHSHEAREEAARKLITAHNSVLRDCTNPEPKTQLELRRVPGDLSSHADECLREVSRRLLGRRPGIEQLEERLDPNMQAQVMAWQGCAQYMISRIQGTEQEKPGRKPDMSNAAAQAARDVFREVGSGQRALSMQGSAVTSWAPIQQLMANQAGGEQADGAAAQHAPAAREEAAKRLIANHVAVLRDTTNDAPLTQKDLRRVPHQHAAHVEECLHEVCRRLLGRRPGSEQIAIRADQPSRAAAWAMTAQYLCGRIQGTKKQKPGRAPDMSEAAAAAAKAVLQEVGAAGGGMQRFDV